MPAWPDRHSQKIHFEKMKYIDLEEAKAEAVHKIRMNGPQKARVTSFGSGWEGGSRGETVFCFFPSFL